MHVVGIWMKMALSFPAVMKPCELPLHAWEDTYATLHRWMQIVGKVRLALAPKWNHWWQTTFYLTARGLTTSPIPFKTLHFDIEFDFIDHELQIRYQR